ncbi:hypothetical protein [Epilithonimonas sp.]|uniref:hypothetical protein n=1 Tax=Epilithonimonas sp. TaxID=2894511 RepID=UPI002FDD0D23
MIIIRPRINDFYNVPFSQEEVDFAIPFLDEDIPLYVDPFLLWKSPSMQDNSLHTVLVNSFNSLGHNYIKGNTNDSINILIQSSECEEVGLGNSKTKQGKKISLKESSKILELFKNIPQIHKSGFTHFEEIQLFVENISKDRVSDITCNIIKSWLIDYTISQCDKHNIPIEKSKINVFDYKSGKFKEEETWLPENPNTKSPIIFTPKRWLRFIPYINYEEYFEKYFLKELGGQFEEPLSRVEILDYNRYNYDVVETYIKIKERNSETLKNDPLFKQIPILSSKRKFRTIAKLPTGKTENADKEYEKNLCQILASVLYPHLDFASEQSRTENGVHIRDLIFYNNQSYPILKDLYELYNCKQIIFELKNVKEVENEHVNQLNRYLTNSFGNFGIIFTRNKPPKKVIENTISLWSGQRKCILILDDEDLKLMCQLYEGKQRNPIDVINKKYIEFTRLLPS